MAYDITPNGVENARVFFNDDALAKGSRGNFDGLKSTFRNDFYYRSRGV